MKTQFNNYFNTFKTYSIQDKFIICFLGALTLTCLILFIFAFITIGAEITGLSLATFPLMFTIDTETKKGKNRAEKIKQMKAVLNDTCELWFNNILIGGGVEIAKGREEMTQGELTQYYGNERETTLSQIVIVKPPKSQEDMDILLDGLNDIWSSGVVFCMVQGKLATFENVRKFNEQNKNKKSINQNKTK